MPYRNPVLAVGEIYHVFNHSINDEEVFVDKRNLARLLDLVDFYRFPQKIRYSKFQSLPNYLKENYLLNIKSKTPLVEIYSFALMSNHYHLLLKQTQENGIEKLIANFQNSFAKFYNLKTNRRGALFQNSFKAKRLSTDEEFLHVSRYIHLNPVTSFLIEFKNLFTYPWTSFSWYLNTKENRFLDFNYLFKMFKSKEDFITFVSDQVDYQRKLGKIKKLIME